MADDEMGAWLHHYTEELYSELLGQNQTTIPPPHTEAPAQQFLYNMVAPPQYPPSTVAPPIKSTPSLNFQMFSRMRGKGSEARSNSTLAAEAVVKSGGEASSGFVGGLGRDSVFERVSSSLGTSGDPISSACTTTTTVLNYTTSEEGGDKMVEVEDRKRKQKQKQKQPEIDPSTTTATSVMYYEDVEAHDASNYNMKDSWGLLHPTKRTRAAEVHNLSERKRRDKINEKMKALQELVPQCNKSDKASMLDEVIEYLKSLQMQLQIMSVGCGMVPMMYPGMQQQFMPPVMGMGMGMGMGMDRPMIPYSSNTPGFNFQNSLAIGTGPQNRPVRMPLVAAASSMSVNQGDYVPVQNPNLVDSYQQYMALQQMQMRMRMQVVQDQSISRLGSSNNEDQPMPSTSKSDGEDDQ